MLTIEQLKQAVHKKGITKTDVALLCAASGGSSISTAAIKKLALDAGFRGAKQTNFGAHLNSAADKVFRTPNGWELTDAGRKHVAQIAAQGLSTSPAALEAQNLRSLLSKLKNEDARAFLTEAIVCAEQSLLRAAVVLSWVGAMALLYETVFDQHIKAFNAEAVRRDQKWKEAKTIDDLGKMKEATFLEITESLSIIGKNVKQELELCLKLRNGCGHPNSLRIGSNKVAAHLEVLAFNVYAKFS